MRGFRPLSAYSMPPLCLVKMREGVRYCAVRPCSLDIGRSIDLVDVIQWEQEVDLGGHGRRQSFSACPRVSPGVVNVIDACDLDALDGVPVRPALDPAMEIRNLIQIRLIVERPRWKLRSLRRSTS